VQVGTLYGISIGTGDPELITLKGLRLLQKAAIVAFPAGREDKAGIAETIISPHLQPHQQKLALDFPYVQDEQILSQAWEKAAETVWEYLQRGIDVAFACEGDVSFYSTFTYLAKTLEQLHPEAKMETIPGVSSPMAAAAALSLPLTMQSQRLVVLPALYRVDELEQVLNWAEVVVLLKVSSVYQQVWQVLQQRNLLERAWVVEKASFPQQLIYQDLGHHPQLSLSYFSLLIIHNQPN
jgi:precorrin-2/cobalt-factor-2 C20-methyltransferase